MQNEIQTLANHPHLSRLVGSHNKACGLQIWFLRVRAEGYEGTRLLYGRMLPADFIGDQWNGRAEDDFRRVNDDMQAEIARVNLFTTAAKATTFLQAFFAGQTFADASAAASIRISVLVGARYGRFAINSEIRLRSPMHLPSRDYYRFESARLSPSPGASVTSAALSSLDKSNLFRFGDTSLPKLATMCCEHLSRDTGMEFKDLDAWRWGDFELLVFPARDDRERDLLSVSGNGKEVLLAIDGPLVHTSAARYLVRFDLMNDECLAHTIVKELPANALPTTLTLQVPSVVSETVDAYRLSVDAECSADMAWYPCVRWGAYLVREVNLQVQLDGGARIKWDWLSDASRAVHKQRLQDVEGLARGRLASASVIGNRKGDAWVPANRQARAFTRTLVPTRSDGRFLLTYAEGEGDGRLELVEWLRSVLLRNSDKQVVWFDPYMEDVGVNLLGSQSPEAGDYIIFTNYPAPERKTDCIDDIASFLRSIQRSLDGKPTAEKPKQSRIANLLAAAKRWEKTGIGNRLRIACLPPETFHDRMLLVTNGRNEPVVGYHLSNSIQLANQNYPLLITPIPADVLQRVVAYMQALLTPEVGEEEAARDAPATIIYDSALRESGRVPRVRKDIFEYALTPAICAWWLQEPALASLSNSELRGQLERRGVAEGSSLRSPEFDQLPKQLFALPLPFTDFDAAWAALGTIFASSMSGDAIDAAALPPLPAETTNGLENYLSDRALAEPVQRGERSVPDLSEELSAGLPALLTRSARALSAFTSFGVDVAWGDYYAIKVLWQTSPLRAVAWVRKTAVERWNDDTRRLHCLKCAISVMGHSIEWGCSRQQLEALFSSQLDFLRWMGFVAVESSLVGGQNSLQSIHALPGVQGRTKAQLLGWLVGHGSDRLDQVTYSALVADYLASLPATLAYDELKDALDILRGHLDRLSDACLDVFATIVAPLVEASRLSTGVAAQAWVNELLRCWKDKDRSISFRPDSELPFTEQAGFLLGNSDTASQNKLLNLLSTQISGFKRLIQQPLAADADWSEVNRSFRLLTWAGLLLKSAYLNLPRPHQSEERMRVLFAEVDAVLSRRTARDWERFGGDFLYRAHEAFASHLTAVLAQGPSAAAT